MNFKPGTTIHGFKLVEERPVEELNAIGRLFEHEKSGARLLSINNDDDNKVFSISFRTPPSDSTGVPHILEHSVLCGSRKFPTKEPFVELIKGSLNTFLNAMTFPDKTMYPIASRNEKDFFNLMDVYLDAVLYPNLYNTKEILMQEGWHYELENKEDDITYKGVVYNEMQGAFSSPEGVLMRKIQESLFKDTTYHYESGGDPDNIPDLTQEDFVNFHKKFYHPVNSYIFLYGDGNLEKELAFINDNYLKNFTKIEVDSKIERQKPYEKMEEIEAEYSISKEDDDKDKTFLSMNYVMGDATNAEEYLAFAILEYLLLENQAAPLKKALFDAELGKDVFAVYDCSAIQPTFSVVLKGSNADKKDEFKKVVTSTLEKLVKEGIDKKLIEACINITEFRLREADTGGYPKGVVYNMTVLDSWLYDGDPYAHIQYEKTLEKMRTALTTRYFEELIDKYILNNPHSTLLVLKPKKGLADERNNAVKDKLKKFKESLSEEELNEIINNTNKLKIRQTTPDSEEALQSIPLLSKEDINPTAEEIPQEIKTVDKLTTLHQNIFTSKIAYVDFVFEASTVEEELVPYLTILSRILGKVDTEKHTYGELSNEINIHTGGIFFAPDVYADVNKKDTLHKKFVCKSKALGSKIPELMELISEIISSSKFEDKKRIKEIIQQTKSRVEMKIFDRGHSVAANRLTSYFSAGGAYIDKIEGLSFYKFITELEKNFDSKFEEVKKNLEKLCTAIFNENNMILNVTSEDEEYNRVIDNLNVVRKVLGTNILPQMIYRSEEGKKNEGLLTPGNVQYVAEGYSFKKLGYDYSGKLLVMKTITSLDYLWNKVRVQGGAYGCMVRVTRGGSLVFVSYRDPNLKETLKVYDNAWDYLDNFKASEREMMKYIIGTISELDTPLTPSMKADKALGDYIRGLTQSQIQRERDEVLGTREEDIKKLSGLVRDVMAQGYYCVLGNENKIKENKEMFNNLINVFE